MYVKIRFVSLLFLKMLKMTTLCVYIMSVTAASLSWPSEYEQPAELPHVCSWNAPPPFHLPSTMSEEVTTRVITTNVPELAKAYLLLEAGVPRAIGVVLYKHTRWYDDIAFLYQNNVPSCSFGSATTTKTSYLKPSFSSKAEQIDSSSDTCVAARIICYFDSQSAKFKSAVSSNSPSSTSSRRDRVEILNLLLELNYPPGFVDHVKPKKVDLTICYPCVQGRVDSNLLSAVSASVRYYEAVHRLGRAFVYADSMETFIKLQEYFKTTAHRLAEVTVVLLEHRAVTHDELLGRYDCSLRAMQLGTDWVMSVGFSDVLTWPYARSLAWADVFPRHFDAVTFGVSRIPLPSGNSHGDREDESQMHCSEEAGVGCNGCGQGGRLYAVRGSVLSTVVPYSASFPHALHRSYYHNILHVRHQRGGVYVRRYADLSPHPLTTTWNLPRIEADKIFSTGENSTETSGQSHKSAADMTASRCSTPLSSLVELHGWLCRARAVFTVDVWSRGEKPWERNDSGGGESSSVQPPRSHTEESVQPPRSHAEEIVLEGARDCTRRDSKVSIRSDYQDGGLCDTIRSNNANKTSLFMKGTGWSGIARNLSVTTCEDMTPLMYACSFARTFFVKLFLSSVSGGRSVNQQDGGGNSALMLACSHGLLEKAQQANLKVASRHKFIATAELLLKVEGLNVNLQNKNGYSALMFAAGGGYSSIVELLLRSDDLDVNLAQSRGDTALALAAMSGRTSIVQRLLKVRDLMVNLQNREGLSALMWAAMKGHSAVVHYLLRSNHVEVNLKGKSGQNALMLASLRGHAAVVEKLLANKAASAGSVVDINAQDSLGSTALMKASRRGSSDIVALILRQKSVEVNMKDKDGRTSMILAAMGGHTATLRLLIDHGADVEMRDNVGRTALIAASESGRDGVVDVLLGVENLNFDAQDNNGRTGLLAASSSGHRSTVEMFLLYEEVKINLKDSTGKTALMWAVINRHPAAVEMLMEKGVDVNQQFSNNISALMFSSYEGSTDIVKLLLRDRDVDLNLRDSNGWSALLRAAARGHNDVIVLLLRTYSADVNLQDKEGRTALMIAARYEFRSTVLLLLAARGIDVNSQDISGKSALMIASFYGYKEIVMILLKAEGVNIGMKDNAGNTALSIAENSGHADVAKLIVYSLYSTSRYNTVLYAAIVVSFLLYLFYKYPSFKRAWNKK